MFKVEKVLHKGVTPNFDVLRLFKLKFRKRCYTRRSFQKEITRLKEERSSLRRMFYRSRDRYEKVLLRHNYKIFMKHVKDKSLRDRYYRATKMLWKKRLSRQGSSGELTVIRELDDKLKGMKLSQIRIPEIDEKYEVTEAIKRVEENLQSSFIDFKGNKIRADYKTIVIARQEERSFFGKLRNRRDVIISFHNRFSTGNLKDLAAICSIDDVKNLADNSIVSIENEQRYLQKESKFKSGWRLFEIKVDEDESLKETLENKCSDFEIDPNLIKCEEQIWQDIKAFTEQHIADLRKDGIRKVSLAIDREEKLHNEQKNDRGIRF